MSVHEVVLTDHDMGHGVVRVATLNRGRWPITIYGANESTVFMTDQEGRALLKVLQERFPLDGLAGV